MKKTTRPSHIKLTRQGELVHLALRHPERCVISCQEPHAELGTKVVKLDVHEAIRRQRASFQKTFEALYGPDEGSHPPYPDDMVLMDFLAVNWAWIEPREL